MIGNQQYIHSTAADTKIYKRSGLELKNNDVKQQYCQLPIMVLHAGFSSLQMQFLYYFEL